MRLRFPKQVGRVNDVNFQDLVLGTFHDLGTLMSKSESKNFLKFETSESYGRDKPSLRIVNYKDMTIKQVGMSHFYLVQYLTV